MSTIDKIPSLEKIPLGLGYMVIEDDQILHSAGELENNDEIRRLASKIAYTAAKVPVNPEQGKRDSFKRISKMYVLSEMKDLVHVKPWQFDQDLRVVIEEELNKKFANKVIYELGLCVALFDILKIENSFIFPGDGSSHTRVTFRYVVFRPFIDEILVGKVKSCNKDGVYVTMSFFDDIFIPVGNLQTSSKFDENEQLFVWQYNTGDQTHDLFMDIGEKIRFRVVDEVFLDTTPTGPPKKTDSPFQNTEHKCPYSITASINEPGLGLLSWWS